MSDSDCSNCKEYRGCKFYDRSYSCYKKRVEEIQNHINKKEIAKLKKSLKEIIEFCDDVYRNSDKDMEEFLQLKDASQDVLNLINGE